MNNEIWKEIEGYEEFYEVSNKGRIKSKDFVIKYDNGNDRKHKSKIMNIYIYNRGYYMVGLRKNKKLNHMLVHRVVANAFIPNPNNYPMINHIDSNRLNNNVDNLEWCNAKMNMNHAFNKNRMVRPKKISLTDLSNNQVIIFRSFQLANIFLKRGGNYIYRKLNKGQTIIDGYYVERIYG